MNISDSLSQTFRPPSTLEVIPSEYVINKRKMPILLENINCTGIYHQQRCNKNLFTIVMYKKITSFESK